MGVFLHEVLRMNFYCLPLLHLLGIYSCMNNIPSLVICIPSNHLKVMEKLKFDVTIIGAGPAGSTTAKKIAEHGFDVLIVEKDNYPGETNVCAGGMSKLMFEELGLSLNVIEKTISGQTEFFPWGSRSLDLNYITVNRNVFDKSLANKAIEKGAKMLTNVLVNDISVKKDKANVFSKGYNIESKIVVFADGPNTLAYKKFGIGFKPDSDKTMVSTVCEVKYENNPMDQFEFYHGSKISSWGYGWIFPKRNTLNVGVAVLYSEMNSSVIESLNYLLYTHPLTKEKLKGREKINISSALIPNAPAKRIFGERMLVVGDASGMVDPITSGGIDAAINGGKLAGEICIKALVENDFSSTFLSQYQTSWHKTNDYSNIYSKFLLSNIFLNISKFDENAFAKLFAIAQGGMRNVFKTLKFIHTGKI